MSPQELRIDILNMTSDIVSAYCEKHVVATSDITSLINQTFITLYNLAENGNENPLLSNVKPAVPINKSVTDDYIICLEDGKKLQMLKRHLKTSYNLTLEQYRQRWRLPSDYPFIAPNYSKKRSGIAKNTGLGKKSKKITEKL